MALVRIRPINKKRGNVIRRYTIFKHTFQVEDGWSKVNEAAAKILATKTVDPHDPQSSPVFDICNTLEEAQAMERKDRELTMIAERRTDYKGPRSAALVSMRQDRLVEEKKHESPEMTAIRVDHVGIITDGEEFGIDGEGEFDESDDSIDPLLVQEDAEELVSDEDSEPEGIETADVTAQEQKKVIAQRPRSPATAKKKAAAKKGAKNGK
jgi:hypothetical protein